MPELGTHGHGWCRVERGVVHQLKQRFGHGMVTLHFPMETPLDEVLKHIKDATKGSDGKRLSIYVDPQALEEAEKTMASPVIIDLEDVPLRFSLRPVLEQLGLAYCVRDGVVMISTVGGIQQELNEAQAEQIGLNPDITPARKFRILAHTNPTRQRGL